MKDMFRCKKIIISLFASALIMFLPLGLTVNYVGGNDGLGMILLLFFVVNPIVSIILGIISGKYFKKLFYIPLVNAIFYLASAWIFLEPLETDFILYAVVYAVIGIAAAFVTSLIVNRKNKA